MKTSIFLAAAVLALLFLSQPAAASGEFAEAPQLTRALAACPVGTPGVTPLAAVAEGSSLGVGQTDDPANIINGPCSWCTPSSNCSTACIDDNGNDSDCGEYGVCDPCKEAIVEIDREIIGLTATRKWVTLCEYKSHYLVTYKSLNAGCSPFTVCETETETHTVCCLPCCAVAPGCFGQSCP